MQQSYQVGHSTGIIKLEVTVGTVGTAYSEFSRVKNGASSGVLGHSTPKDGNIPETSIGTAESNNGAYIFVGVIINLNRFTMEQRESAIENLYINYKFSGGVNGTENFSFQKQSDLTITPKKNIVSISSIIQLL
ncbi:hypothetical protein [Epilithonimonas hungarica]|uniref:Uncharacterized protein n=1 Tax=Epilithonimonas hungarica TaxID=454006 RepID=A0A1G7TLK0_9FLAO|nr:hypothetical protein [Epilithonimonas hungarica]SDG36216.1 hypothetical protein SAMN05421825_3156 [Epilithonimonas hungarica]